MGFGIQNRDEIVHIISFYEVYPINIHGQIWNDFFQKGGLI